MKLQIPDRALRKKNGSYYTPPEVVAAMVRLVDEALMRREQASVQPILGAIGHFALHIVQDRGLIEQVLTRITLSDRQRSRSLVGVLDGFQSS